MAGSAPRISHLISSFVKYGSLRFVGIRGLTFFWGAEQGNLWGPMSFVWLGSLYRRSR